MPVEAIEIMILFIKVRDKGYFVIEATFFHTTAQYLITYQIAPIPLSLQ